MNEKSKNYANSNLLKINKQMTQLMINMIDKNKFSINIISKFV